jgi:1-deoxy-D-xylulose-5-phosphate reductoisomerase
MQAAARRVIVLGSTGSVGTQTLQVIEHLNALHERGEFPTRQEVVGLAAGRNAGALADQHARYPSSQLAITGDDGPRHARFTGPDAAARLVAEVECDLVVAAIAGAAGLPAAWNAVRLGRDVALANKETLVVAGEIVVAEARRSGSRLLPIDSEHAALWQCLAARQGGEGGEQRGPPPMSVARSVQRVWITASGGPFRERPPEEVHDATPEQALRHPTWSMGPKVTIDSATLMNKALETIEAHWLFGLHARQIGVLIHPQSIIHAMVERADGGIIAHLAAQDMRHPIQHALAWPHDAPACSRALNWRELTSLELRPATDSQQRAINLGARAIDAGGSAGAIVNGANEAAVAAFLERRIPFGRIVPLVETAFGEFNTRPVSSLSDALEADAQARAWVEHRIAR